MPSITSRLLLEYLLGTDPLGDVADNIQTLADRLDDIIGGPSVSGTQACTVSASNTSYTQTVSFPSWFTDMCDDLAITPVVVLCPSVSSINSSQDIRWGVTGITSSGFTINYQRSSTANIDFMWIAQAKA